MTFKGPMAVLQWDSVHMHYMHPTVCMFANYSLPVGRPALSNIAFIFHILQLSYNLAVLSSHAHSLC